MRVLALKTQAVYELEDLLYSLSNYSGLNNPDFNLTVAMITSSEDLARVPYMC